MNNIELAAGICTGGIPDDSFQDEHHERHQAFLDARQAQIESDATELMRTGNEFDPWTWDHITEACGQSEDDGFPGSVEMTKFVYDYWRWIALKVAEIRLKF